MKVLMFNTRLDALKSWGGDSTQMVATQKELQRLGVDADLVVETPKDISKWDLVHLLNLQKAENGLDLLNKAKAIGKPIALSTIYWDLRQSYYHPDVLRYGPSSVYRWIAAFAPRLAVVMNRIQRTRGYLTRRTAQERMVRAVDILLPNSIAELEILVSLFCLPELRGKAVVVPNAVSPPKMTSGISTGHAIPLPEEYLLMAARFDPVKGQDRLISALQDFPQIPVVCIGSGLEDTFYGQYCKSLAAKRGNTYLFNAIPHDEMPRIYEKARVHALPSLRESPGLASLEAASYGANCVVAFHAPVWEYFENDAFVCNPEDPLSLQQAIFLAWEAPPAAKLRKKILETFTWQHAAGKTLQGYEIAMRKKQQRIRSKTQII